MRAFLALDFENSREATRRLAALEPRGAGVKVGLELFTAVGPTVVRRYRARGWRVFLDLKLYDIPRTMERAAAAAAALGADLLTVHASAGPEGVAAAVRGATSSGHVGLRILAVTVLTSQEGGVDTVRRVGHLAREAVRAGAHGLVCSVDEARAVREGVGPEPLIVTPGIRFEGGPSHDQRRVATPERAAREGADAIVIGRAVWEAPQPAKALRDALRAFDAARRG